jgi:hypothetical protein
MFEWGGGCVWCGNEATYTLYDVGNIEDKLPISESLRTEFLRLSVWHDKALDWSNPTAPGPWGQEEFERFDRAAIAAATQLQNELGSDYEVVYVQLGAA